MGLSTVNIVRLLVGVIAGASLMACSQNQGANSQSSALNEIGRDVEIIGGQPTLETDPLSRGVVALYDTNKHALCTASIVSAKYLVTAAHCVTPGQTSGLRVVYGNNISDKSSIVAVGAVISAEQSPLWKTNQNAAKNSGDVALVRLASAPPQGFTAMQILSDASVLQVGAPVLLEGYGVDTGHPLANSQDDNGAGILREVVTKILNPNYSESEVLLDQSQGKGACHGDSGGPAYANVNGKAVLFGVTSRGTDQFCAQGVIYTNLMAYKSWFPKAVEDLEAEAVRVASFMQPRLQ